MTLRPLLQGEVTGNLNSRLLTVGLVQVEQIPSDVLKILGFEERKGLVVAAIQRSSGIPLVDLSGASLHLTMSFEGRGSDKKRYRELPFGAAIGEAEGSNMFHDGGGDRIGIRVFRIPSPDGVEDMSIRFSVHGRDGETIGESAGAGERVTLISLDGRPAQKPAGVLHASNRAGGAVIGHGR